MINIDYSISLWNFTHYSNSPSLERILASLRSQGYGVEIWGNWRDEKDLYDPAGRARLKAALAGMPVSLHTITGCTSFDLHQKQIDAAAELGAKVLVLHPDDLYQPGTRLLNLELANRSVEYAQKNGVRLALENGQLGFLVEAIHAVPGLNFCLDIGHVYLTTEPLIRFLTELKHRLIHIHLQDILVPAEQSLPGTIKDHTIPGTGAIPAEDWALFSKTLDEINFTGTAVFEIMPRNPFQTALVGREFLKKYLG